MPIRVLPKTRAPAPAQGTRESGIMDAFTRYNDLFGTREDKMDLDIAKAMKEPGSMMGHNRQVWMKALDMVDKGQVPTRGMFRSDEEFRYFKKVHADAVNVVENMGAPAFEKEYLAKRITNLEDQLATAQSGYGIGLDRITEGYKHPAEMIAMKLRAEDGLHQENLEKMKERYEWSPAAGPDTPVGRDDFYTPVGRDDLYRIELSESPKFADGGRAGYAQGGRTGYQA